MPVRPSITPYVLSLGLAACSIETTELRAIEVETVGPPCETPAAAYWPLDERVGPLAMDVSGNGNHGTHVGDPVPVPGAVSLGLRFDGNDYVEVPDDDALDVGTGNFSLSYHIQTESTQLDVIVDKRVEQSGPVRGFVAYIQGGRVGFQLANGAGWSNITGITPIHDGQWHEVLISVDRDHPSGGKIYIDGELDRTFNPTARQGDLSNDKPLRIGRRSDSGWTGYFNGVLDEIVLTKAALADPRECLPPIEPCLPEDCSDQQALVQPCPEGMEPIGSLECADVEGECTWVENVECVPTQVRI